MAEKSGNFWGGFLLGTIAGSALGVVLGAQLNKILDPEASANSDDDSTIPSSSEELATRTKRGLERKIAQLNEAIDAVSQELTASEANGKSPIKSASAPTVIE